MPRNGSGVMSWPSGGDGVPNTPIESAKYNAFRADLLADLNAARPVSAGGTGATTASGARTNLGINRANLGAATAVKTKTGDYTALIGDRAALLRFTTAATLSLTSAATLTADWFVDVIAVGVDVAIDPDGSEQIDGASTLTIPAGMTARIYSDGSGFYTDLISVSATTSRPGFVKLATGAGYRAGSAADQALTPASVFGDCTVLTDGTNIAVDLATGYDFSGAANAPLALGGNRTLSAPTNAKNGQKGILWFGASGATRQLTLNAAWNLLANVETGPYSITTSQTLGVAYVVRGTTVYVTSILRAG